MTVITADARTAPVALTSETTTPTGDYAPDVLDACFSVVVASEFGPLPLNAHRLVLIQRHFGLDTTSYALALGVPVDDLVAMIMGRAPIDADTLAPALSRLELFTDSVRAMLVGEVTAGGVLRRYRTVDALRAARPCAPAWATVKWWEHVASGASITACLQGVDFTDEIA